jgi:aquaporin Z
MNVRAILAEFLGTLLLVLFAVGSAVLSGEFIQTVGIALAFGLVLVALCYAIGPISGCHVNPAVTLGALLAKRIDPVNAVGYWIAQFAGGIAGAAILYGIAKSVPGLETHGKFGTNGYGSRSAAHISQGGAFAAEVVLTFLLVFVVLAVTHRMATAPLAGLGIGLSLTVIHLVGIPLTGTSVNPARSLGPALFAGDGALSQLWLFIVAPLVGGVLAAVVHLVLYPQPAVEIVVAEELAPAVD